MRLSTLFISFVYFIILNKSFVLMMSRPQIKNAAKVFKKSCMPKNDVTEEQVGTIEQGKFLEERNVMCYIACIFTMWQVVKNNKLVHEAMLKQVDMIYPAEIKESAKVAMDKCKGVAKQYKDDICEASFRTAKCVYEADPPSFVFP